MSEDNGICVWCEREDPPRYATRQYEVGGLTLPFHDPGCARKWARHQGLGAVKPRRVEPILAR